MIYLGIQAQLLIICSVSRSAAFHSAVLLCSGRRSDTCARLRNASSARKAGLNIVTPVRLRSVIGVLHFAVLLSRARLTCMPAQHGCRTRPWSVLHPLHGQLRCSMLVGPACDRQPRRDSEDHHSTRFRWRCPWRRSVSNLRRGFQIYTKQKSCKAQTYRGCGGYGRGLWQWLVTAKSEWSGLPVASRGCWCSRPKPWCSRQRELHWKFVCAIG